MKLNTLSRRLPMAAIPLLGLLCPGASGGPVAYTVLDLHPSSVHGGWSAATAINEHGQIAANITYAASDGSFDRGRAYRTAPNTPINLGSDDLGSFGNRFTVATDVNERGQVVGYETAALIFYTGMSARAFRTAPNSPIDPATDDLGTFGGPGALAWSINDDGWVTGDSTTASGRLRGFLVGPADIINSTTGDIGSLAPSSFTSGGAVNNAGQVVGWSRTASAPSALNRGVKLL